VKVFCQGLPADFLVGPSACVTIRLLRGSLLSDIKQSRSRVRNAP